MSVAKIALGVFLGNLAFALLAWIALSIVGQSLTNRVAIDQTNRDYDVLQHRQLAPSPAP